MIKKGGQKGANSPRTLVLLPLLPVMVVSSSTWRSSSETDGVYRTIHGRGGRTDSLSEIKEMEFQGCVDRGVSRGTVRIQVVMLANLRLG
jgi:hypothetical protein